VKVNPYCMVQFTSNKDSGLAASFTTCVLHETNPQWHETFRFDCEHLDPGACMVVWILTAPGTTAQEVIDSSTLGMDAEEVQARARQLALLGKASKQGKKGDFAGSMQGIFDNLMFKANRIQKMEESKARDKEANEVLRMGARNIANSLQARRWLQVQNFQTNLAHQIKIPSPPVPPSHMPLGVVVVRFRQLREAVWSADPMVLYRSLRLNSRGRLTVQIDFRPRFQQVPDPARSQPVRPFHTPRKVEMKESELEIGSPTGKSRAKKDAGAAELDASTVHHEHTKSMGKAFFDVQKWSKTANLVGDAYEEAELNAGVRKGGIADSYAVRAIRKGIIHVKKQIDRRRYYDTQIQPPDDDDQDKQVNQFFAEQPKYIAPAIRMDNRMISRVDDSRLY